MVGLILIINIIFLFNFNHHLLYLFLNNIVLLQEAPPPLPLLLLPPPLRLKQVIMHAPFLFQAFAHSIFIFVKSACIGGKYLLEFFLFLKKKNVRVYNTLLLLVDFLKTRYFLVFSRICLVNIFVIGCILFELRQIFI